MPAKVEKLEKFADILAKKGIGMEFQYGGKSAEANAEREFQYTPTARANKLRELYFQTLSSVSTEFPYWYTRKYKEVEYDVPVIRRATALACAFEHLTPTIWPGELLVQGKALYYRGSFPFPWLSETFFLAKEDELYQSALQSGGASADEISKIGSGGGNVTESFGKVVSIAGKFGIRSEEVPALVKLAREWANKSVEDLGHKYEMDVPEYQTKENMMRTLMCMFDSGYTLPQGREVISYYYPLQYGWDGILKIAEEGVQKVAGNADGDGIAGMDRLYFYKACIILIKGIQKWMHNYADEAKRLAIRTSNPEQKKEYLDIAKCMEWIAHHQPRTFREALQLTYSIHTIIVNEDALSGESPGRLGQILWPWFEQDRAAGRITEDEVVELLECHRIKFTCYDCFASFGVVGGVLSGNTFNNLHVGGVTREGKDAGNRLDWLILHAGMTCATPQPTLSILYDEVTNEELLMKAAECTKIGTGYPAWFGNRTAVEFCADKYRNEGITIEEARAVGIGGCLETVPGTWKTITLNGKNYEIPVGCSQPGAVGVHFIGNPMVLNAVLFNGKDLRTGIQVFPPHDKKLETFEELFEQFKIYYELGIECLRKTNNIQHDIWRKNNMCLIQSMLKPNCLDKGHHIGNLGYRFNGTFNIESCGTANMVNSMAALKKLVYDEKKYTLDEMRDALSNNFGFKKATDVGSYSLAEQLKDTADTTFDDIHGDCLRAPKYGNDDKYADNILLSYERWFTSVAHKFESLYGLDMYTCQNSVSTHGTQGTATIATADGRLFGTTYADGSMSAYPGTDRNGPYAMFNSATIWDQTRSQNSQMNMKVHPSAIRGDAGTRRLLDLVRAYLRKGGFHVQFNIVDSKVLKGAQTDPDQFRELMVRVAGFTQYWVEIGKPIQDEVIARTEYEGV